jgi:hypothetical protein
MFRINDDAKIRHDDFNGEQSEQKNEGEKCNLFYLNYNLLRVHSTGYTKIATKMAV